GREPTADEFAHHQDLWRAARLRPIAEHLPADLKRRYEEWAQTLPPEESVAALSAGWFSPQSPKTADELLGMSDEALVNYLRQVQLGDERFGPSREGLGQALGEAVDREPPRFSRLAGSFAELDPAYQHALFSGLHQALTNKREFAWESVLDLGAA